MIKKFYVNNIKNYPHDEILYLFKRVLITEINNFSSELLIRLTVVEVKDLINNIKELTINDERELNLAAITLFNDQRSNFTDL